MAAKRKTSRTTPKKTGGVRSRHVRVSRGVTDTLEALKCNPFEIMARIAMDESQDVKLRAAMAKELAVYAAPKPKAADADGAAPADVGEIISRAWAGGTQSAGNTRP
ncbi:MAG: hypothetical protein V3S92_05190 [Alphaproteobacteria bacterium]